MQDRHLRHDLIALPRLTACALLVTGCRPPEATTRPPVPTEKTATTSPVPPRAAVEPLELRGRTRAWQAANSDRCLDTFLLDGLAEKGLGQLPG
jgi:hypothetical protein